MYLVDLHILPAILDPLVSSVGFAPVGLLLFVIAVAAFIYRAKVTLTEKEHARIVRELEEKWDEMSK